MQSFDDMQVWKFGILEQQLPRYSNHVYKKKSSHEDISNANSSGSESDIYLCQLLEPKICPILSNRIRKWWRSSEVGRKS